MITTSAFDEVHAENDSQGEVRGLMRAAAEHLCFIDSGHLSIDRCHLMPHTLLQQGYDRGAPVDLQLIRSSGTTIAWHLPVVSFDQEKEPKL